MAKTYWNLLWSSFNRILGPPATIISLSLAIIIWKFLPSAPVELAVVVSILIIFAAIIMTLLDFSITATDTITALEKNQMKMPQILFSQTVPGSNYISCLLEPSELFSEDIAVSFNYAPPGSFEVQIGVGYVTLINTNKKIQVMLIQQTSGYDEEIRGLINNNMNIIKDIYVKPNIRRSYLLLDGVES